MTVERGEVKNGSFCEPKIKHDFTKLFLDLFVDLIKSFLAKAHISHQPINQSMLSKCGAATLLQTARGSRASLPNYQ